MNKHKQMMRVIIRQAAIYAAVVIACGGIYFLTDDMVTDSEKAKTDAGNALGADQGQVSNLTSQIDKAGLADKRFLAIEGSRTTEEFNADTDALKEFLRRAKSQYRFSNSFKLSLTTDKKADNKEFAGLNYDVLEHPGMKLEFSAISDVHLFSFLDDLTRHAPGFVRIDGLSIKKVGDINASAINQMNSGAAPYLVEVKVEFNWIGLREKPSKDAAATAPGGSK